jgi:MrcB-like, N-terminal domain
MSAPGVTPTCRESRDCLALDRRRDARGAQWGRPGRPRSGGAVAGASYVGFVTIREMLAVPSRLAYRPSDGQRQPAQIQLRAARADVAQLLPPGYRARVSGGGRSPPYVPWLAVLDEDVTTTAREGLYAVYLFAEPLDHVHLSMNQGVTAHYERLRDLSGRDPKTPQ